jgi:hypothetical protein
LDHRHAYSHRQGESVTRSDRRRRELKLENSSPSLARLRESNGVVTRWVLAEQGGGSQSDNPILKLGTVNLASPFEIPVLLTTKLVLFCSHRDGRQCGS